MTPRPGRDRLRELLDAVLADGNRRLESMAGEAYSSPYHFSRVLSREVGEPPVTLRRRVMLERAAWQLRQGSSVTDAAFAAEYESVEGFGRAFARAYGHAPSETGATGPRDHWLPAPNGLHFHPPTSLWVHSEETPMNPVTDILVRHDLDDTRAVLDLAKQVAPERLAEPLLPGHTVLTWDGPEESAADLLERLVWSKEVWLAAVAGDDQPARGSADLPDVVRRHEAVAGPWLATVRDLDRRGAWGDQVVDALCDPPESFVLGSVLAHVLTYSAHRRQLVRHLLRELGVAVDQGDPIEWLRDQHEAGSTRGPA